MAPWFSTALVTASVPPGLTAPAALVTEVTTRSGRPTSSAGPAKQLFDSSFSAATDRSSAQASRTYEPGGVADGMVTVTAPADDAPGARLATERDPVRRMSSALRATSGEA